MNMSLLDEIVACPEVVHKPRGTDHLLPEPTPEEDIITCSKRKLITHEQETSSGKPRRCYYYF